MFIKSLSVKNFKKFPELSVGFNSDICVVRGPNEQGKSTLLSAFLAGLFFDPKKRNKDILELKSWNSDNLYEITLDFEHNGEETMLYKNFESGEIFLENKTKNQKFNTYNQISDFLYEAAALRSLELFEHTACVKHDALARMAEGRKNISQALLGLITASEEGVSSEKILKKVSDLISDLQRGAQKQAKNPGLLKRLQDELAELAVRRDKISAELSESAKQKAALAALEEQGERAKTELEIKKSQYQKNLDYFKSKDELAKLNAEIARLDGDLKSLGEIAEKKNYFLFQLKKMGALAQFDWEKFSEQKEAIAAKKEKLNYLNKDIADMGAGKKKSVKRVKKAHLAASLILFLLGFLSFLDVRFFAFFALFAGSAFYSFILKRGITKRTSAGLNKEADALAHEISVIEKQIENMLSDNQVKDEKELIQNVKNYNDYGQELARLESKEEGILRSGTLDGLKEQKNEILKRIAVEEAKISSDEYKAALPSPEAQRTLEIEMQKLQKELERLGKDMARAGALADVLSRDHEELVRVEEEIEYKGKQKEKVERKLKTLETLYSALGEAQQKTIARSRLGIEEYIKKYLPVITDGRYNNIRVKDDLSFEVWSEEKKSMIVPEDHLSKGTIDQFYLIARLSVLNILNKGTKSFLFLDDPFTGFDAQRRARAREILADLTGAFQIIIFTHSPEYDDWGQVVNI